MTLGHDCHPPELAVAPLVSPDVFVENQGVLRKDDLLAPHCCGVSCHQGIAVGGSQEVFVNKKPVMRLTEMVKCPAIPTPGFPQKTSVMVTSARRTFAGG